MIVATDKTRAKRLADAVRRELESSGVSAVAVLTELGVRRMSLALQRIANETGRRISAVPTKETVDGVSVMVIVVTLDADDVTPAVDGGDGDTDE